VAGFGLRVQGLSFWETREMAERHRLSRMQFIDRMTSAANVQVEEMLDFDVTFAELKGITDFLG